MIENLGHKLKIARLRAGMKQQDVADRLGVTSQAISSYEAAGSNPNAQTLMKLAGIYGESTDYLLGLDKKKALFIDGLSDDEVDSLHTVANLYRKAKE